MAPVIARVTWRRLPRMAVVDSMVATTSGLLGGRGRTGKAEKRGKETKRLSTNLPSSSSATSIAPPRKGLCGLFDAHRDERCRSPRTGWSDAQDRNRQGAEHTRRLGVGGGPHAPWGVFGIHHPRITRSVGTPKVMYAKRYECKGAVQPCERIEDKLMQANYGSLNERLVQG